MTLEQGQPLAIQQAIDLAVQHHTAGDLPKAEGIYQQILQANPNQPIALNLLGVIAQQVGKNDIAADLITKAITIKPDYAEAHYNLGIALQALGKIDGAGERFSKAIAIKPDYFEAHSNLGNIFKILGKTDEAVVSYKKAIAIKPDFSDVYSNLGIIFQELGQLDDALAVYSKAIAIKPDYVEAHYNLGIALQELGQLDEAVASYNKALVIKPDYAEAYSNLGGVLKDLGKLNEAVDSYNKALAIKPSYVEAYSNLGNVLKEQGKLDEANASYNKALAIRPDYAEAHSNLGTTLQDLGKFDQAVISCNNALAIKPDFAEAHSNLGTALHELGQLDEALTSFNRALVIKPDFAEARFRLGVLLYVTKQFKKAMEQFKLTNFGKSKSFILRSLYELDEQSLFYDQLDDLINQGEVNPVIGSLCSRSEIRYGGNRLNPFCNDPLKYVSKIDLTDQYDFDNIFVKTAKNILSDDTISHKSQGLLANGYQTAGNLLLLKIDFIEEIKRILKAEIEKYRLCFNDSGEGFIRHWPKEYNLHGWLISMKSGGNLSPHMHEEGWISGSVYINVPRKLKTDSGNLVVCIDDQEYATSANKNLKKSIDVVTGSLCLFPASLLHYTIPFESNEERIVLAFDVKPK